MCLEALENSFHITSNLLYMWMVGSFYYKFVATKVSAVVESVLVILVIILTTVSLKGTVPRYNSYV